MATSVAGLSKPVTPEILGPETLSQYEQKRLALRHEYTGIIEAAKAVTEIKNPQQAEEAVNLGRLLQGASKETATFFTEIKREIDKVKAPILEAEKEDAGALSKAKDGLSKLLTAWDQQVARENAERQRLAQEEAERQAREERLQQAIELEESGDSHQAEAVLAQAEEHIPVITQQISAPKMAGKVSNIRYGAELVDLMTLVKAVAEGRAPLNCILANESYIRRRGSDDKETFNIPGCRLTKSQSTNFRS